MPRLEMQVASHSAKLKAAFSISRGSKLHAETVRVRLCRDGRSGRGESVPYARYGESVAGVIAQIEAVRTQIEAGPDRHDLQGILPPGAARCAVDCALWDLEAKTSGRPVFSRLGVSPLARVPSALTLSLDTPHAMAQAAHECSGQLLKLKLGGRDDLLRVEAVHAARPGARLILDGNEAIAPTDLPELARRASELGVVMIEQPLAVGKDDALRRGALAVAICADESAHTADDIAALAQRYDAVNIKLDKAGGLTGARDMLDAARAAGLLTMVGCMVAGSLSLAPAFWLAQRADYADLDGPLWLVEDEPGGLAFENGQALMPSRQLWG